MSGVLACRDRTIPDAERWTVSYYRECPHCGAHLDPGERCFDCARVQKKTAPEPESPKAASKNIYLILHEEE